MHHAASTNRKDRAHREARREKFNGNFSEDAILRGELSENIEFPQLSERQVLQERERIRVQHLKRKKNRVWILLITLVISIISIGALYAATGGFEYWGSILPK